MPKDATKNLDRYKIRGGHLNEFEYTERQQALAEKKPQGRAKLIPGTPPEEAGEGLQPTVKATSKAGKSTKATKKKANTSARKGATPKKLAARKAASKK